MQTKEFAIDHFRVKNFFALLESANRCHISPPLLTNFLALSQAESRNIHSTHLKNRHFTHLARPESSSHPASHNPFF